jgi:hypothetical protein
MAPSHGNISNVCQALHPYEQMRSVYIYVQANEEEARFKKGMQANQRIRVYASMIWLAVFP